MSVKGLPLAYNKDLQETQQPVFAAAGQVSSMLRVATGFMATVEFDYKRMQRAATRGFMNAMAAAAYLVRQGVPFRRAHELVGKAVRLCLEKSCELEQLSPEDFALCGIKADQQFYDALTLTNVLAIHDVEGGTAPRAGAGGPARGQRETIHVFRSCPCVRVAPNFPMPLPSSN